MDPTVVESTEHEPSALSELLQEFRAKKGWTYSRIVVEIEKQTGYRRTESTVRFCVNGRAGNGKWVHKGLRRVGEEPSTASLVAFVLEVPEKRLRAAIAQDLLAQSLDVDIAFRVANTYFPQKPSTLRIHKRKSLTQREKRAVSRAS